MKTLVTGISGFLGSHIAARLGQMGQDVIGVDIQRPEKFFGEFHQGAVEELLLLRIDFSQVDTVYHCAGGSSVGLSEQDPFEDYGRTLPSLTALLNRIRTCEHRVKFFFPSSASVYGESRSERKVEGEPLAPVSPYGFHKKLCEELLSFYAQRLPLDVLVVRYFSLYGPGLRKQLLWDALGKFRDGVGTFHGSGQEERDFLFVDDAVEMAIHLVESLKVPFRVVNGGTGSATSVSAVLNHLARKSSFRGQISFSQKAKSGDPSSLVADIGLLTSLGFCPLTSLEEGLERVVAWYRQNA